MGPELVTTITGNIIGCGTEVARLGLIKLVLTQRTKPLKSYGEVETPGGIYRQKGV